MVAARGIRGPVPCIPARFFITFWTFEWSHGRRLTSAEGNEYELSFTYNDEGIRTSKTVDASTHIYNLNGSQIITEKWDNHLLIYFYDADGSPMGMQYRKESYGQYVYDTFWFDKNLQGDIVAVYNESGTKLISYKYDAWGNFTTTYHNGCTASSTAAKNPFRYRGYYYDVELGMYYLQSRHYDPIVGRFINADKYISTGQGIMGYNMYAYCLNNPVNFRDSDGETADSYAGWIGEQLGEWLCELITGNSHPNKQTRELETQMIQQQNELITDVGSTLWDAYVHSNELQVQQQYQQDMMVIGVANFLTENPLIAVDVATGAVGTGLTYVGLAAAIAGISIPVGGQIIMGVIGTICGAWGMYRIGGVILEGISE